MIASILLFPFGEKRGQGWHNALQSGMRATHCCHVDHVIPKFSVKRIAPVSIERQIK
jgi:hypothetical protein